MPFTARKANFNALRKLNLQDRIAAVQDQQTGQFLISMLTPTQAAELFPHYYVERNPNISGFLRALPSSLSAMKQREYEQQLNNTASGSSAGSNYNAGGYRKKWQEAMDTERSTVSRKGYKPPPQLSPEQKAAFDSLKAGDIDVSDDRVKWIRGLTDNQLLDVGLSKIKDAQGKEKFHYSAPQISEEQAKLSMATTGDERSARKSAETYLGRSMTDNEWSLLLSTTKAEATSHKGETAMVMATILNRARVGWGGNTIDEVVSAKQQFTSWTNGSARVPPNEKRKQSMFESASMLTGIPHNQTEFASADVAAYNTAADGGGGSRKIQERLNRGFTRVGGQIFNAGSQSVLTPGVAPDPITHNYTPQQIAARQQQMAVEAEAGRLGKLASITQPGGGDGAGSTLAQRYAGKAFPNAKGNTECAAFAQQAGGVGHTSGWSPGSASTSGSLKPGDWVATFNGGKYTNTYGESHTAMFTGYQRDQSGKITGIKVLEQFNKIGSVREHTYPMTGAGGEHDAGSYYQIVDKGRPASVSETVDQNAAPAPTRPKMDDTDQRRPTGANETERDKTVKTQAAQSIKPLTDITQPGGPTNTPDTAKVEPPKPAASGNRFTFNKDAYLNEVGNKQPMAYSFVGPGREGVWKDTVKGLRDAESQGVLSYNEKTGALNIKDMNHPKVQEILGDMKKYNLDKDTFMKKHEDVPTQVKPKAQGGSTKVSTEQIAAYPIGGLQGDNTVVVNAQQKPLFTMNTNEAAVMNPDTKTVDVLPNKKNNALGPQQQTDTTSPMMDEFQSAIKDLQKGFADMQTKAAKAPDLDKPATDQFNQNWLAALGHATEIPYRNPTTHRVASRANGVETGGADNNYHYSKGNKS